MLVLSGSIKNLIVRIYMRLFSKLAHKLIVDVCNIMCFVVNTNLSLNLRNTSGDFLAVTTIPTP